MIADGQLDGWNWVAFDADDETAREQGFNYKCPVCDRSVDSVAGEYWYNEITEAVRCADHPPADIDA